MTVGQLSICPEKSAFICCGNATTPVGPFRPNSLRGGRTLGRRRIPRPEKWRALTSLCHTMRFTCLERPRNVHVHVHVRDRAAIPKPKIYGRPSWNTRPDRRQRRASRPWARPLARPVTLRGGSSLVTLADVRTFLFKRMQGNRRESPNWQRVTALLLSAARSDEVDVADVTIALEMAASMDEGPPKPEPK